ncbi:winged helix-turn-helix transcriptional regulator [Actinokineospora enzanensis]|uniref:winged helix-turn-helix transcriptional regulator n=1 Tax=Actinokineospora enzanensis TaxID=155975 RepID=UPI00037B5914|nr:winged helix-turn-helix transcriptional regulator [Actinokineospora enzanensis]
MESQLTFDVLGVMSRKWSISVLGALSSGAKTHNELARTVGVDNQQLDRVLRRLVAKGLIRRYVHTSSAPIRVSYSLTGWGAEIVCWLADLPEPAPRRGPA